MECTQALIDNYSLEHYTFINQIFGDATVREIICDIFTNNKNKHYRFFVEEVNNDLFERGFHHILVNDNNETLYCSVDSGHQNLNKNVNDTLCQSYSLLKFLGKQLDEIFDNKSLKPKQKYMLIHKEMINMYREIISNKKFIREFNTIDFVNTFEEDGVTKSFRDYTKPNNNELNLDSKVILQKIKEVLDKWEKYGYWYFIGTGKCNNKKIEPLLL